MCPLDDPILAALGSLQAKFARSSGAAMRFPPEMTLLGALRESSAEAYASLQHLTQGQPVTLYSSSPLQLPVVWIVVRQVELYQMVHDDVEAAKQTAREDDCEVLALTEADIPEMSLVYAATRPGRTLCPRIQQLGLFLGVRHEGKLAAMGGLRLHISGYREITTVGTLPGHTGRGYATAIVAELVRRIRQAGERPFLTVGTDNTRAIEIYRRFGFKERARLHSQTIRFRGSNSWQS